MLPAIFQFGWLAACFSLDASSATKWGFQKLNIALLDIFLFSFPSTILSIISVINFELHQKYRTIMFWHLSMSVYMIYFPHFKYCFFIPWYGYTVIDFCYHLEIFKISDHGESRNNSSLWRGGVLIGGGMWERSGSCKYSTSGSEWWLHGCVYI